MNIRWIWVFLLLIVIILLVGVFFIMSQNKKTITPVVKVAPDIEIFNPKENEVISSPLKIKGIVRSNSWSGFEGQVGTVRLLDSKGKELTIGILTATEDWMKLPVNFETTIFFDYPSDGVGNLIFHNENASGEPSRNKTFTLPVKLQKSSSANTKLKIYFSQSGNVADCATVFPVERQISQTQSVARVALEELLKGPTGLEKYAGLVSSIGGGVKIQSLIIENGTAKVDFNEELQKDVAGSCKVMAIRAQIEQTLKQFPTVKSVVISIDGKVEDILQP